MKCRLSTNPVRSLLQDDEGFVWLGIRSFGLVRHDLNTDKCIHYTDLPEFRSVLVMPTGNAMMQRRNGEIWFATYNGGIY
ncbi:two-component regulator propeller domain-containing protein, partial [Odoribacter sp. N15.MGS-14]|uniref:two-component regulator propeller domain-containing protein n=1 Tax=Odoribacter sp. N15.MGS-14 TaxID=1637502 RepID=UPI0025799734